MSSSSSPEATEPDAPAAPRPDWSNPDPKVRIVVIRETTADNWDSYGAHKVTDEALDLAELLIDTIFPIPTTDGGMQVVFASEGVTIEINPDGTLEGVTTYWSDVQRLLAKKRLTAAGASTPTTSGQVKDGF